MEFHLKNAPGFKLPPDLGAMDNEHGHVMAAPADTSNPRVI